MTSPEAAAERRESLQTAFNLFNKLSEELSGSYRDLQLQVLQLSRELAAARTERMLQLAEKEQLADRLERLLETLPAAVIVLDGNQRVQEFNAAAKKMFVSIHPDADWRHVLAVQRIPNPASNNELRLRDGSIVSLTSRRLEQAAGLILVMLDVTETRRLQERLNRRERLSAMGQMSAQLAHQMRTPLSSALLYASHLANDDLSEEQRRRFTGKLRTRLQHMEHQIRDILLFARGASDALEPVSLVELVEDFAEAAAMQLQQAGAGLDVRIESPSELRVMGRKHALHAVLNNLLDNALQHGASHIRLSLRGGPKIRLRFQDDGTGIPQACRQQIFDPFFTTRSEGTGLGLAVVQNLMLSHNAEIRLADGDTPGTRFELVFPAAAAQRKHVAVDHAANPTVYRSRVN